MFMAFLLALLGAVACSVAAEPVSIHKVDYPEVGLCGEEQNVEKSDMNPHYFFPMHFGGFREGPCSDEGFTIFNRSVVIDMHPLPWIHHNLTFLLYSKPALDLKGLIGTQVVTFKDPSRKNRTVSAKVCIPASGSSNDAESKWPLYIFGHGFDCKPEDYAYFCKVAITVLVFETNTTFIDWDTKNLAADAAFLSTEVPRQAQHDPTFFLAGKLNGLVVLGGHSMGGGTSVLAAADHPSASGMALFAPGLYTLPPAAPYLKDVSIPTLIVSGSDDCGPNQLPKQAQPAFDGLASEFKVLVSLKGANHCQWAEPSQGEIGVCSVPFFKECALIEPAVQHELGVTLFSAFLDGLRDGGWSGFEATLAQGEQKGTWTYFSSKTSAPDKKLQNDCPCKKDFIV